MRKSKAELNNLLSEYTDKKEALTLLIETEQNLNKKNDHKKNLIKINKKLKQVEQEIKGADEEWN